MHDTSANEATSSTPDFVRREWACRELSDFRRWTSSRDYSQRPQRIEEQAHVTNPQQPSPMATPSTALDHPDLRVNGMFLPQ